jgi:hypothetical protein
MSPIVQKNSNHHIKHSTFLNDVTTFQKDLFSNFDELQRTDRQRKQFAISICSSNRRECSSVANESNRNSIRVIVEAGATFLSLNKSSTSHSQKISPSCGVDDFTFHNSQENTRNCSVFSRWSFGTAICVSSSKIFHFP